MDTGAVGGEWMTYDQIAEARGTAKIGAIRWVQRHRLRRQPGNDGMVRILVDPTMLPQTGPQRRSTPTVTPDGAVLVEAANRRADEANKRADAALALADRAGDRADRAEARAEELRRDLDAARVIAGAAQHDAQAALAEARDAQRSAEELRQAPEAVRKARGRLRRAWDGWRGR